MIKANQLVWAQTDEQKTTIIKVGQQVPSFNYRLTDALHSISSLQGKVTLITFFATWCGPCNNELPPIQEEIYDEYKNNPDFQLLVIGREHSDQELLQFQHEKGFHFPLIADPKREIYSLFAQSYIPRNFLVNKEGKVIYQSVGYNEDKFRILKTHIKKQLTN